METPYHIPALFEESLEALQIKPQGRYVDLTLGGGGHSRGIVERLSKKGRLYAFDQDQEAHANLPDDPRVVPVHSNFRFFRTWLRHVDALPVDGILADLGVSFHHFDASERGFSFRFEEAPLDMRMNQSAQLTAATLLNTYEHTALTALFRDYGELPSAHKIAYAIEAARSSAPLQTTGQLIEAVASQVPRGGESKFYAKLFQALRIEVNGEMEALRMMLEQTTRALAPGGRLAIITYHSLEDRLVKHFMRTGSCDGRQEVDFFGRTTSPWRIISRKAILPSAEEVARNPRARSAKLRICERL